MSVAFNENAGPYSSPVSRFEKVIGATNTPSLKEQVVNSKHAKHSVGSDTLELIDYIRSPEPAHVKNSHNSKIFTKQDRLSSLHENTLSGSLPESSSVSPTRNFANEGHLVHVDVPAYYHEVPPLLPDDAPLDLRCLGNTFDPSFDVPPLKINYRDYRLIEDDTIRMEWKVQQILSCELNDEKQFPSFAKELELHEKASQSKWYDYPLYYAFGIDRTGLFQLKDEFDWYQKHPWSAFDQIGSEFLDLDLEEDSAANISTSDCAANDEELTLPISEASERSLDRYLP
ncbi:unnamed protein product [Kluyveromyces dobzhanskii CBS 2104]|uniref:WGS project CCBQ000000000 data, contig 00015 n=1 Tax=Kluyveromyces dobzhanskii CBS 2104 TaxID=1427455 RepID=A0A0A8LAD7_9SACH|nr:unnamed protein product [Kluyveromyces dobzhanskii CBS 2104]